MLPSRSFDHNDLILMAYTATLHTFCQDVQFQRVLLTDEARWSLADEFFLSGKEQHDLVADLTIHALIPSFYQSFVQQWQTDPSFDLVLEEWALTSSDHQLRWIEAGTRRRLLNGSLLEEYPLPCGLADGHPLALVGLILGLSAVCQDYPQTVADHQKIERKSTFMLNRFHQKLETLPPILRSREADESLLKYFVRAYILVADLFLVHRAFANLLVPLVRQHPDPWTGLSQAFSWLVCHLRDETSIPAQQLASETFDACELDLVVLLAHPRGVFCALEGCTQRAHPVLLLEFPLTDERRFRSMVSACAQHHPEVQASCRGQRLLDAARSLADHQSTTMTELPRAHVIAVSPRPGGLKRFTTLIERFRQRQRWPDDHLVAQALQQIAGDAGRLFGHAFMDANVDLAVKARIDPAAIAVALSLPFLSLDEAFTKAMEYGRCWMTLAEPIPTIHGTIHGFSFGQNGEESIAFAQKRTGLRPGLFERVRYILREYTLSNAWGLDACDERGDALYSITCDPRRHPDGTVQRVWLLQDWLRVCADPLCGKNETLCSQCQTEAAGYLGLYANLVRLLLREVSSEEDPQPFAAEHEAVVRNEPDPKQPHKYQQRSITHTYYQVTFNALLKKPQPVTGKRPGRSRGSWLDRLDPAAVIWVSRPIGEGAHILRHKRFHNYILKHGGDPTDPRGFALEINAHTRQVPTSLRGFRQVKHVIFQSIDPHNHV